MLLDFKTLVGKYEIKIDGIIHCGAHLAEEAQEYFDLRINNVWWVEANPLVMPKLRPRVREYKHHLIEALLGDENGKETEFNITNFDGMSSSIYEFGKLHLNSSPETVFETTRTLKMRTLDSLVTEYHIVGCNFLNMDLQGAEVPTLRGAAQLLKSIDYVYTEVNVAEVYEGIELLPVMEEILMNQDLVRVETSMTPAKWGDALFVRKSLL